MNATATRRPIAHIAADDLLRSLKIAGAAVKRGSTPKEILKYVLIELKDTVGRVHGSDGDVGVNACLVGIDCDSPFRVCVAYDTLVGVLAGGGNDPVSLSLDYGVLVVKKGRGNFRIPTWPNAEEFPPVSDGSGFEGGMMVPLDALRTAIERTTFATEEVSTRYAMNGVGIEGSDETLLLVATDSRRLSIVPLFAEGVIVPDPTPVVPIGALEAVKRMGGESVYVSFSDNEVAFVGDDASVISRLISGRFPRYQQVVPKSFHDEVEIPAGPILSALRSASMFTSPDSLSCDLVLNDGDLSLLSSTKDRGACDVSIPVKFDGHFEITLQPKFLIDFASKLDPSETFTFGFTDSKSAVLLTAGDWKYVVMPLSVDRKA